MSNINKFNASTPGVLFATLAADGYKTGHHKMYPEGTTFIVDHFTPRSVKYMPEGAKEILNAGQQFAMKYIHDFFQTNFFDIDHDLVMAETKRLLSGYLGTDYDVSHFSKLHKKGYLPIDVFALPEGTITKPGVPILAYCNDPNEPDFYWLPNFLETLLSCQLWKTLHSASLIFAYKKLLTKAALETDKENVGFVDFQIHDFSMRGMQGYEAAIASSIGFAMCSKGSDTIPVMQALEYYYQANETVYSVNATEHSVMTPKGPEGEFEQFERLIKDVFPSGILSIVSDSYDLWAVLTDFLPKLKEDILARDGKIVIRPDSGNPVDILCGTFEVIPDGKGGLKYADTEPKHKGVIELLWDVFGGTVNEQGYKVLNPKVGAIYGDSITLERAEKITARLKEKGFASTNVVFGVGSYSMGFATRDSQGSAVKACYATINGQNYNIQKDPITDDGLKKSIKGLPVVYKDDNGDYAVRDEADLADFVFNNELDLIYRNGEFQKVVTLEEIRDRINKLV